MICQIIGLYGMFNNFIPEHTNLQPVRPVKLVTRDKGNEPENLPTRKPPWFDHQGVLFVLDLIANL